MFPWLYSRELQIRVNNNAMRIEAICDEHLRRVFILGLLSGCFDVRIPNNSQSRLALVRCPYQGCDLVEISLSIT